MAEIVLGIAASHSPLMVLDAGYWPQRAADDRVNRHLFTADGREMTYAELEAISGTRYKRLAVASEFEARDAACQSTLDRLADELEQAAPDVVVVIGDDQNELLSRSNYPALAVFYGEEVTTTDLRNHPDREEWQRVSSSSYLMDEVHALKGAPALGLDVIDGLIDRYVDVAAMSKVDNPKMRGFGHAFGFVAHRLLRGRPTPMLPVLLNTFYPPNVVRAGRAFDIGLALGEAIEASPLDLRVAVVASGGLSHFVVDEALDREVMRGLEPGQGDRLRRIPPEALKSGNSEILNWIATAGAVGGLRLNWQAYVPIYRTPAGTGLGAGFACWKPDRRFAPGPEQAR